MSKVCKSIMLWGDDDLSQTSTSVSTPKSGQVERKDHVVDEIEDNVAEE
jgi:hypothetical protein